MRIETKQIAERVAAEGEGGVATWVFKYLPNNCSFDKVSNWLFLKKNCAIGVFGPNLLFW